MSKDKISQYDATAANNTDVSGVNIAEGCAPSGINNAIREVMAALKRFETGSDGDSVTVGGNLVVSGSTTANTFSTSNLVATTADINGGTIDGAVIGGASAAAGTFTTATATTGNITTVNATTVDTTSIEVTNIKAKDGTAAATIADSTGVFTHSTATVFPAGSNTAPSITTAGDTNTGIFFPAADTIAFTEGGVEAMRITSDARIGIGTSSPSVKLDVVGSSAGTKLTLAKLRNTDTANNSGSAIELSGFYNGGRIAGITPNAGASVAGALVFDVNNSSNSYFEAMRIDSSGNVLIGKTSATANGGDLQVSKGITFPATQSAQSDANTLDDYEEGTWTPVLASGFSSAPTSYNSQVGTYTKIGKMVYFSFYLLASGATANASVIEISGLPFTVANTSADKWGATIGYQQAFNTNTGDRIYAANNATKIGFATSAGADRLGNDAGVNINAILQVFGMYATT